jgi:hypothetical protein
MPRGVPNNHRREMCCELLINTPGLSFSQRAKENPQFRQACTKVFSGAAPRPDMTTTEAEGNICEFLNECDNHFHFLTICPYHSLLAPCACRETVFRYYDRIANCLRKSWGRPIDPDDISAIVEATLYARIEDIKKNGIWRIDNLILLNVHILLCGFSEFKNSHGYRPVRSLFWTVTGAIEQKQEARKRMETLLRQRQVRNIRSVLGAGNLSAAYLADTKEKFVPLLKFLLL